LNQMPALVETLKGQARHVMHCLGKGHREAIYHAALITALNHKGVTHRSEVPCPIWFMGQCIGMGRADLVIGDMIVEIKANKLPPSETSAQLQKYLQSLSQADQRDYRGVVINFNQRTGFVDVLEESMTRRRNERLVVGGSLLLAGPPVESRFFKRARESLPTQPVAKRRRT
jgi:GxxExxY protein